MCETGKKEGVRDAIHSTLGKLGFPVRIVWGPENDEFYGRRDPGFVYVEIELLEKGDRYYSKNRLLGSSIIPSSVSIFMHNELEDTLSHLIGLPIPANNIRERAYIFLNDRKGLVDFKRQIEEHDGEYDPLRVMSHLVRNAAWTLTGTFVPLYDQALHILEHSNRNLCDTKILEEFKIMMIGDDSLKLRDKQTLVTTMLDQLVDSIGNL